MSERQNAEASGEGETRFNLSLTSLILLTTAIIALAGWGVRLEHRASPDTIRGIVDTKLHGHPALLPPGSIIAYVGKDTSAPDGWSICGRGAGQFPNLDGYFLVGTSDFNKVGKETGSKEHEHSIDIPSTGEQAGELQIQGPEYADNHAGQNWYHEHRVKGPTKSASHTPLAIQVLFFCKQRNTN